MNSGPALEECRFATYTALLLPLYALTTITVPGTGFREWSDPFSEVSIISLVIFGFPIVIFGPCVFLFPQQRFSTFLKLFTPYFLVLLGMAYCVMLKSWVFGYDRGYTWWRMTQIWGEKGIWYFVMIPPCVAGLAVWGVLRHVNGRGASAPEP